MNAATSTVSAHVGADHPVVYSVKSYGALGDNINDDTASIQSAIDAASTGGGGTVYFPPGTYRVTDTLHVKKLVSLAGAGHDSDNASRKISSIEFERSADAPVREAGIFVDGRSHSAGGEEVVFFVLRDLMLKARSSGWQEVIKLIESHNAIIRSCYFAGRPENAAVWLGATLYTVIEDNFFALTNGHGIDAKESNHDVAYYGTNWSQIIRNRFSVFYSAFIGNGNFTFTQNAIEAPLMASEAKVIIDANVEKGGASYPDIVDNYVEIADEDPADLGYDPSMPRFPCKFLLLKDNVNKGVIDRNFMKCNAYQEGSVAVDFTNVAYTGAVCDNWIDGFQRAISHGSSASNYSFAGNTWPAGANYSIKDIPSVVLSSMVLESPNEQDLVYYRKVVRGAWQTVSDLSSLPNLKAGYNIAVMILEDGSDWLPLLTEIEDAELFPGATVRIYCQGRQISILHSGLNSRHFNLKNQSDMLLEKGRAIEFVVSPEGYLVEV